MVLKRDWRLLRRTIIILSILGWIILTSMYGSSPYNYRDDALPTELFSLALLVGILLQLLQLSGDDGPMATPKIGRRIVHSIAAGLFLGYLAYVWVDNMVYAFDLATENKFSMTTMIGWIVGTVGGLAGAYSVDNIIQSMYRYRQAFVLFMAFALIGGLSSIMDALARVSEADMALDVTRHSLNGLRMISFSCAVGAIAPLAYLILFYSTYQVERRRLREVRAPFEK